jgi:hypothetical protein
MGGDFDRVVAGNHGQSQRRALGFGVRRQTLEVEFEVPDGAIGRALLRRRQRPIGRGALDKQVDRRADGRRNIDDDAIVRMSSVTGAVEVLEELGVGSAHE